MHGGESSFFPKFGISVPKFPRDEVQRAGLPPAPAKNIFFGIPIIFANTHYLCRLVPKPLSLPPLSLQNLIIFAAFSDKNVFRANLIIFAAWWPNHYLCQVFFNHLDLIFDDFSGVHINWHVTLVYKYILILESMQ